MNAPEIVLENEGVRIVARTVAELIEEGKEESRYTGSKWGSLYLRAPDIFYRIFEKAGDKLVRLGDIAEVRRGFTTGANDFFYLKPLELTVKEVAELRHKDPHAPVQVSNEAGWEGEIEAAWLRPAVKSPREVKTLAIRLKDLQYLLFIPPDDVHEAIERGGRQPLQGYALAEVYIRWGEEQGYHRRSTCKSRPRWWNLSSTHTGPIAWTVIQADKHSVFDNSIGAELDHNFYEINSGKIDLQLRLISVCISTFMVLSKELFGRRYGGGAIKTEGVDLKMLPALDILSLTKLHDLRFDQILSKLRKQPIKSFLEELGFPLCHQRRCQHPEHPYEHVQPEALTLEQVQKASPDRFELDSVVFDVLGLSDEERLEVYRAVAQMIKERQGKAKNRGNERQPRR